MSPPTAPSPGSHTYLNPFISISFLDDLQPLALSDSQLILTSCLSPTRKESRFAPPPPIAHLKFYTHPHLVAKHHMCRAGEGSGSQGWGGRLFKELPSLLTFIEVRKLSILSLERVEDRYCLKYCVDLLHTSLIFEGHWESFKAVSLNQSPYLTIKTTIGPDDTK